MISTPKLNLALLACIALTDICAAEPPPPPITSTRAAALLNSPPLVPLSQAADFSGMSSSWNFSAGYQWRQIGDLNFNTGSQAANGSLPWMAGRGRSGSVSSSTSSASSTGTPATTATSTSSSGSNANTGTAGSASAFADRTYIDGYVNQFPGTAATGRTWFWGYNNASQVSGGTLTYHASAPGVTTTTTSTATGGSTETQTTVNSTTTFSTRSSSWSGLSGDLNWDSELAGSGWFGRIESPAIFARGALAVSIELGYSFATADAARRNASVFSAHQESEQRATTTVSAASTSTTTTATGGGTTTASTTNAITDTYDVSTIAVPGAPYAGTLAGPGPLITNIPATRTITPTTTSTTTGAIPTATSDTASSNTVIGGGTVVSSTTADFFSNVTESLDVDLHTISIGPHFSMEWQRVRVGLSTGLAINVADWDADYREDLYVSENGGRAQLLGMYQDHKGGAKVLPGFYIETNANVRLTRRVSLFAGGRYDWAGTLRGSVGPSNFALALGGWTAMGGVTITF